MINNKTKDDNRNLRLGFLQAEIWVYPSESTECPIEDTWSVTQFRLDVMSTSSLSRLPFHFRWEHIHMLSRHFQQKSPGNSRKKNRIHPSKIIHMLSRQCLLIFNWTMPLPVSYSTLEKRYNQCNPLNHQNWNEHLMHQRYIQEGCRPKGILPKIGLVWVAKIIHGFE